MSARPAASAASTAAAGPAAPTPSPLVREGAPEDLLLGLVERAASLLSELPDDGAGRLVVGLVGAPGSGKSTLAGRLCEMLTARGLLAGCVPMDGFHLSNAVLDELGRHGRKGAPDTFDVGGYLAALDRVRSTGDDGAPAQVLAPVYRRDLHEPVAAGTRIAGRGVVVTEGNYLALEGHGWEGARERIDLLVMLEVPTAELITRLVERHTAFGRARAEASHWVRVVDLPNAELVAAGAGRCDELWRPVDQHR